jgi:multimeric flavodoxin WrbA
MTEKQLLLVGASTRNCASQEMLVDATSEIGDEAALYEYIEDVARSGKISNSEICGIAASYGALKEGVKIKYLRLNDFINKKGVFSKKHELLENIEDSDGFVFLTPVYFGDKSSLLYDLFVLMKKQDINLDGKISSISSVGAKRNGGQETTNIYTLYNLLQMGSLAVGNGPPTSQYGGTAVGGNMGTMDNDYFGLMTSMGAGTRAASTIKLLHTKPVKKPTISFWILEDFPDKRLFNYLDVLVGSISFGANFQILDFTDNSFHQCLACNQCPNRKNELEYKCVIQSDDLAEIQNSLVESDGYIVCGLNYEDEKEKISNYQRFVERTRYMRRDNFVLSDRLFSCLSINQLFADNSYDLRVLTSFIRHNSIAHRGVRVFDIDGQMVQPDIVSIINSFSNSCSKSATYRAKHKTQHRYENIGY